MISGKRELVIGMTRDPQFGPCIMFGMGGIFAEVFKDVSFRVAPLTKDDAIDMISEIKSKDILTDFRGEVKVDDNLLVDLLLKTGIIAMDHPEISEIDINPLIIRDGKPVAVDALVVL